MEMGECWFERAGKVTGVGGKRGVRGLCVYCGSYKVMLILGMVVFPGVEGGKDDGEL